MMIKAMSKKVKAKIRKILQNKVKAVLLSPVLANLMVLFLVMIIFKYKYSFFPVQKKTSVGLASLWMLSVFFILAERNGFSQWALILKCSLAILVAVYLCLQLRRRTWICDDIQRINQQ